MVSLFQLWAPTGRNRKSITSFIRTFFPSSTGVSLQTRTLPMPHPLVPVPTPETQPFWDGCQEGILRINKCLTCGSAYFPPSPICPECSSTDVEFFDASGDATLYSYTIQQKPFFLWGSEGPRSVALVKLAEGPMLTSSIINCEQTPEALQLHMPFRATFTPFDEITVLCFEPAEQQS